MYPFPQAVNPALRSHVDAQTAFLNDISKSVFHSFQQMCNLNIQLTQTLLEESVLTSKQVMSNDRQSDLIGAATARIQPTRDKLRAYHQHIARLAADTQVDLARVTEKHVQTTTHTARTLAEEVSRDATEQTERGMRAQQETIRQFSDPFTGAGNRAASAWQEASHGDNGAAGRQHAQPGHSEFESQAQRSTSPA